MPTGDDFNAWLSLTSKKVPEDSWKDAFTGKDKDVGHLKMAFKIGKDGIDQSHIVCCYGTEDMNLDDQRSCPLCCNTIPFITKNFEMLSDLNKLYTGKDDDILSSKVSKMNTDSLDGKGR